VTGGEVIVRILLFLVLVVVSVVFGIASSMAAALFLRHIPVNPHRGILVQIVFAYIG